MDNADIDYEESQVSDKWINLKEVIKVLTKNRVHFYDMVKITSELKELPSVKQEPSVEIVKTEESNDNDTKYLNINVSDDEVKRNPDIVRLCSDVGMLEYAKPKTGHWIESNIPNEKYVCSECGGACWYYDYQGDVAKSRYCPNCGAKMVESQESEE